MPRTTPLTRRTLLRLGGGALGLSAVALLAACGGPTSGSQAGSAPTVSPTDVAPVTAAPQAAVLPSPTTAPHATTAAGATTVPATASVPTPTPGATATMRPSALPNIVPPAAPATATLPPFNGIPQGRTPEGFPTLGNAAAPVKLIDYSDFL